MVVKLVVREYVVTQRKFDVEFLNGSINLFNYGYLEQRNKPSANFNLLKLREKGHSLSQKAAQMWCLTRALPFLLCGKVSEDDEYMQLILSLLRVMEIIFAPRIPVSSLPYLDDVYNEFFSSFVALFPNVDLINKMHHGSHGRECIQWSGPLSLYNCIRFEAKHSELKLRAQNVHNFKNAPKTLVRVSQAVQCSRWYSGDVKIDKLDIISGENKFVCHTQSREYLRQMNSADDKSVFCARSVEVNGVEYRKHLFIVLEKASTSSNDLITFGEIREIIVIGEKVFLLTSVCTTLYFDTSVHAYCIELSDLNDSNTFTETSKLPFHKTFCYWTKPTSDALYISLRHIIL
ncbi:hypothetical protein QAD02_019379 [Eretmocerus hayati]|uniref:Uncharacterized protein n=1 Tax=Eretmocerus hayati TaxID=131215 RepID=A0ACC2PJP1_9HYME|nr:hypothetical protein QAD02_019379 [Eretmocerus hayati]